MVMYTRLGIWYGDVCCLGAGINKGEIVKIKPINLGTVGLTLLVLSFILFHKDARAAKDFFELSGATNLYAPPEVDLNKGIRERFVRIKLNGGVIKKLRSRPSLGCSTPENYVLAMAFLIKGAGSLPSKEKCWGLTEGQQVKFTTCHSNNQVCQFEGGIWPFNKKFWTHINAIDPM